MRKHLFYIASVMVALFTGVLGTLYYTKTYDEVEKIIETTEKVVEVTETNTIKSSISKVYDATILVEVYKKGVLASSGTGFVYKKDDKNGYIITNHHVIESAIGNKGEIRVTNNNGQTVVATLKESDEYADLAVLVIDKEAVMQVAEIGNSSNSEIGDTLFTVGSPLGSEYMGTVTRGILSGKNRMITVSLTSGSFVIEAIQTDAAINPGNSGGPLCNMNGEVIGVNSLKLVQDEIEGMGFAIPIELAMPMVEHLEKGEKIVRPYLGVQLLDATSSYELYFNRIYLDEKVTHGAVLVYVEDNKPASNAGLKKGDVIVEMGGVKVEDTSEFRYLLYKYNIGDEVKVKYYREDEVKETTLILSEKVS